MLKLVALHRARGAGLILVVSCLAGALASCAPPTARKEQVSANTSAPRDREDTIKKIKALIQKGDEDSTTEAVRSLQLQFGQAQIETDPELKALQERAFAADKRATASQRGNDYAERVKMLWTPKLTNMPSAPTVDASALWSRVSDFEEVARGIEEGKEFKQGAGATARSKLVAAASAKQRAMFPVLRRSYGEIIRAQLFRNNVDASVGGSGAKALIFSGVMFADNANIQDAHEAARANFEKLRFSSATYTWARGLDGYRYSIVAPADGEIGYWDAGTFKSIK